MNAQAMLQASSQAMLGDDSSNARTNGRTNATNERFQDTGITPHLPNAAGAVDKGISASQVDEAADVFFATVHEGDMSAWEIRLLNHHLGIGRKPTSQGRKGSPPVPSIEATVRAVREQQRRRGLRPRVKFEFEDWQLAVAARVLEGKAS